MSREHKQEKQEYKAPQLRIIELAADEVLGVGCKLLESGSAYDTIFNCGVLTNNCAQAGS